MQMIKCNRNENNTNGGTKKCNTASLAKTTLDVVCADHCGFCVGKNCLPKM